MRNYRPQGGGYHDSRWSSFNRNNFINNSNRNRSWNYNHVRNYNDFHDYSGKYREHFNNFNYVQPDNAPSYKRRKFSASSWVDSSVNLPQPKGYESAAPTAYNNLVPPALRSNTEVSTSTSGKRDRSKLDEEEPVFMSRDEIERHSPSRKDGIDAVRETHLRYSYCAFIQNLGFRLEL